VTLPLRCGSPVHAFSSNCNSNSASAVHTNVYRGFLSRSSPKKMHHDHLVIITLPNSCSRVLLEKPIVAQLV
jgi:hypothetical protein